MEQETRLPTMHPSTTTAELNRYTLNGLDRAPHPSE